MILSMGKERYQLKTRKNCKGIIFFYHFSRENFEGLEKTREYLYHSMMVTRFRCNRMPPKVWCLERNDRHNTLIEEGVVPRKRSNGRNFSNNANVLQHLLHFDTCPKWLTTWLSTNTTQIHVRYKNSWLPKYNVDPCEDDSNLDIATIHTMYIYVIQTQIWA